LGQRIRILSIMLGRRSATSLIVLLAAACCCAAQNHGASKTQRIEELISHYKKYGYINGAILVAERGKVIYAEGIGDANMESRTPNTPRTKFGIASITKQFSAALVLQQTLEGRIRLEGRITDYLSWYRKDTGDRITIEQLLHHTSGLPPDFDMPEFSDSEAASRHYEPQEFAERFCQSQLTSEPGTKWEYSNCGYDLLGLVLERVTGKPFEVLLRERLLEPLGMKNSGMNRNDLERLGGASGYKRHAGPRYTPGPYIDQGHVFSAGAMYSTVEDLFLWNQALSASTLISKEIRESIFKPGLHDWAYGWFVTKIPPGEPGAGHTLAEMRGDMPGNFFSWILRYPEQDDVIIVLRNGYGSTERLEQNIQAILFDQEPKMPSRSPKDLAAQVYLTPAEWVGTHRPLSVFAGLIAVAVIWWWLNHKARLLNKG